MLKNGACANPSDGDAHNSLRALEEAGCKGHVTMAKVLMPQINTKKTVPSSWDHRAQMITAATCGFLEIIRWVLKNKPSCYNNEAKENRLLLSSYSASSTVKAIDSGHKYTIALLMD